MFQDILLYVRALYNYLKFWSRRTHAISIGGDQILYDTTGVYSKFWFYPRYLNESHEPLVTDLVTVLLSDEATFLDIGANLGYFTCIAGKQCRQVYSYEMDSSLCRLIEKNVKLNGLDNVAIYKTAIAASSGTATYQPGWFKHAGLRIQSSGKGASVLTNALDRYDFSVNKPLLVKIDVEGAEDLVLQGATNLLNHEGDQVIFIIEMHPRQLSEMGSSARDVVDRLQAKDFVILLLADHRKRHRSYLNHLDYSELEELNQNFMIVACKIGLLPLLSDLMT